MRGVCGEAKDSDAIINLSLENDGIDIEIISKLEYMFGSQIKASVIEVLKEFNVKDAFVKIEDYGALDFVIRARTKTALKKALRGEEANE